MKKRKPQDATLRNVRASRKQARSLEKKMVAIEASITKLAYEVITLRRALIGKI